MSLDLRLWRPRRRLVRGWGPAERRTLGIGVFATAVTSAALALEFGRVWRRGSAPLPGESHHLLSAAEEAAAETARVAVAGYADVSSSEKAMFNLLASFVSTFAIARGITYLLRGRATFGPFRDFRVGRRHIHHFVPGIAIAFTSGAVAILRSHDGLGFCLSLAFGTGAGLAFDKILVLLERPNSYCAHQKIAVAQCAAVAAAALAVRFHRRARPPG